ncbi:T9SS type A sorting domain-containing protein [Polaribacter sp. BAL334]|uniref:T9SS type A sorting domain-containing protein n=1 Tax=Polaribacter sp. BAL334 TaxID=1708178 RepID=UPI0018D22743|nr:T9SS type A sorting domain-containing protein [Polaribacter sp. BAL334]MBG7612219.1 T9SS type A sorting domain-containing protein [Polaribacter sp. BAL334]
MKNHISLTLLLLLLTSYKLSANSKKDKPSENNVFTQLRVNLSDGATSRFFRVYYLSENATKGFDNGYDGETFGGITNSFDIFTHLVSGNDGKKYQVQSLPLQEIAAMIIPINIKSQSGKQLVVTTELFNFPSGLNVYFEDKLTNTITRIDQLNTNYTFTTNQAIDSFGRFFIYVSASEPVINSTWNGSISNQWENPNNWTAGVPTAIVNALIPDVLNAPTISSATNTAVNDLIITEPQGVVINSGGSLIVNGISSGNVTYNRNLETENWYLISSPIAGETYDDAYVAANSLAISGTNNAIATYTTANDTWSYMQTGGGAAFSMGKGYSVRRATNQGAGPISFTGTINTTNISMALNNTGRGFNLVGNPFTSYLNNVTFINDNSVNIVGNQIWVWNQGTNNYEVKNLIETIVLAPTQGFFLKTTSAANLNYAKFRQVSTGDVFQKSAKKEIKLNMTDGANSRFAKIYYLDNATTSFDNGYDGETFGGVSNSFDIFMHLVANSEGKKYQVQSLPNSDLENMVIPVGIKAVAGKEITLTADAMNLQEGLKVFLEDKVTNKMTRLDEVNATYKVTFAESLDGIGRFYLHTKSSSVLSTETVALENINVYSLDANTLRVAGLSEGKTSVKIFSILGKQVFETSFDATGVNDMQLPKLIHGIYVVQLTTENGTLNKKILLE